MKRLVVGAAVAVIGIGSANAQPPPPNYAPIPPPRQEVVPPPPGERFIWEPGRWNWDGRGYVWVQGHYVERFHHHHWADGRWVWAPHLGRYVWREGRWE